MIIGRLHPLLVHLPIGIFIIVLLLSVFSMSKKFSFVASSIRFILAAGLISAILSLISGYILSLEASNAENDVALHKWTAIAMTLIYTAYYFFSPILTQYKYPNLIALTIMFVALLVTGHQGGSLTHGEDFLYAEKGSAEEEKIISQPIITDIGKANVYKDVVAYTLQSKCVECHGANKQKGKLRLDNTEWIVKGGKNGKSFVKGDPDNSELIKRILLDENDDHHMPPKKKTQLNASEKNILSWWVKTGASFDATIESLTPDENIKKDLEIFKQSLGGTKNTLKTRSAVSAADEKILSSLKSVGWVVSPIANGDNHLRVSGFNIESSIDTALSLLSGVREQVIELRLGGAGLTDESLKKITLLINLEKLWLNNNSITDNGISMVSGLKNLEYLNVSHTGITMKGLKQLISIPNLNSLYASGTPISSSDLALLKTENIKKKIYVSDTLPFYPTDTLIVRKVR